MSSLRIQGIGTRAQKHNCVTKVLKTLTLEMSKVKMKRV